MDEEKIEEEEIIFPKELVEEIEQVPEEKHKSIYQQILTMGISQKVQLALKGNKEARGILVKDPNKLVCSAVIKSPKVGEPEAAAYASMRGLGDEVVAYIANRREWTKNYRVKLNLVRNPKCPTGAALRFLPFLRKTDLISLSTDRNVPAVVMNTARQMVKGRAAP